MVVREIENRQLVVSFSAMPTARGARVRVGDDQGGQQKPTIEQLAAAEPWGFVNYAVLKLEDPPCLHRQPASLFNSDLAQIFCHYFK